MESRFLKQVEQMRNLTLKKHQGQQVNMTRYEALSKSTLNLARKIVGRNLPPRNLLIKATVLAKNKAATVIQRAYRKSRSVTDETFLKMMNRFQKGNNRNLPRMLNFADREYGTENLNLTRNMIYEKRHYKVTPNVTRIQRVYRGYANRRLTPVIKFVMDLHQDERFKYYAPLLNRLYVSIPRVLTLIRNLPDAEPRNLITHVIGVCHIRPEQVPAKYLGAMQNQLVYVARAYQKMSPVQKKEYLNRLDGHLGGRPCLENTIEALVESLVKPVLVWSGKNIDPPLNKNNARYTNKVMAKAVLTWVQSANKNKVPNSLNARKQMFWNMVKNRELHVRNANGIPMYSTPSRYNVNGKRFKASAVANALENF